MIQNGTRSAVSIQYRRVTDAQTDTESQTDTRRQLLKPPRIMHQSGVRIQIARIRHTYAVDKTYI